MPKFSAWCFLVGGGVDVLCQIPSLVLHPHISAPFFLLLIGAVFVGVGAAGLRAK